MVYKVRKAAINHSNALAFVATASDWITSNICDSILIYCRKLFVINYVTFHWIICEERTKAHWDKSPLGQKPTGQYPTGQKPTAKFGRVDKSPLLKKIG